MQETTNLVEGQRLYVLFTVSTFPFGQVSVEHRPLAGGRKIKDMTEKQLHWTRG